MDQDGFDIALGVMAIAILASGLYRGAFDIQFIHAARKGQPVGYWFCAFVLALLALESLRRGWNGCAEC